MDSKPRNRRGFLKEGAALAGLALGTARSASGQTPGPQAPVAGAHSKDPKEVGSALPLGKEGTLKPDEVYALTAFLLFKNGVIHEDDVMDAQSLPKVAMPNHQGFALPAQEWKHGMPRLPNYP
jgi:hypothetical protein